MNSQPTFLFSTNCMAIVCTLFCRGVESPTKFSKKGGGVDSTSSWVRGGVAIVP